jgi:hypothetical protein
MDHDDVQPMGLREHTHMPKVGLLVNAAEDKTAPRVEIPRRSAQSPSFLGDPALFPDMSPSKGKHK